MSAHIVSVGSFLPGDPITNEELERFVGPVPEDILEGLQVLQRHWMIDPATGEHMIANSEMAEEASRRAIVSGGVDPDDIDLLVVSTASPEYPLPPMATFVQERLGLERCAAIEIRSGCAGAVEALDVARLYVERGEYGTALVVGSEAISPLLVPVFRGRDPMSVRMRDRLALYSFGDGAGAIILRADEGAGGFVGSAHGSVGVGKAAGMQIVGAGTHEPVHKQLEAKRLVELRVDVVASGKFTPFVLTEGVRSTLARAGVEAGSIDLCVIPEGNAGYLTTELEEAGLLTDDWVILEKRLFENLSTVGATGSAAVPIALDEAWRTGRLESGQRVMLLAIETSKWKYSGVVFDWTAVAPAGEPAGASVAEV
jgi:3-oxoacyl-[acyl-carrier-protein] synthase-3